MKTTLSNWQFKGFIFTSIIGVLLHFLFDWTGGSIFVAPFSAVNESIWEHMKLIFFPMFVFAFIENKYIGKSYENFWCIKLIGIILGIVLIPVLYYTINGVFGTTADWVNIAIFFVTAMTSYAIETWLFKKGSINCKSPKRALLILCLIAIVFVLFTFFTPQIPLFEDPITNTYGYYGK